MLPDVGEADRGNAERRWVESVPVSLPCSSTLAWKNRKGRPHVTVWSTLVQTTLLSIGMAVILALVAALIGPIFIDWGQYRAVIESETSQIVGVPVRVGGAIDVRLLPTPSLKLTNVHIGPAALAEKVTVVGLAMEFGLG